MNRCLRVVTYNVHKCRGLDRRSEPARIAAVLRELDADLVALQEVISIAGGAPEQDQPAYIAAQLGGYSASFGENRPVAAGRYGNAVLSRLPITLARNYDLTWRHRERRGCLRTDAVLPDGRVLHLFNVHLGTSFFERRHQARHLVSARVLRAGDLAGPRIVVGDFNEWTRGLATRLMAGHFEELDLRRFLRYRRTYPGVFPLLHLDHFYFDRALPLRHFRVHRSRRALVASDHLPLVADFEITESASQ